MLNSTPSYSLKKSSDILPEAPRETTKVAYHDADDNTPMTVLFTPKLNEVQLTTPMSKEQAHALWAITDLTQKRVSMVIALEEFKFIDSKYFRDTIHKSKTTAQLDSIIVDMLLFSEDKAKEMNEKALAKANPFNID